MADPSPDGSSLNTDGSMPGALELLVCRPLGLARSVLQTVPGAVGQLVSHGSAVIGEAEAKARQARRIGALAVSIGTRQIRRQVDARLPDAWRGVAGLAGNVVGVNGRAASPPVTAPTPPAAFVPPHAPSRPAAQAAAARSRKAPARKRGAGKAPARPATTRPAATPATAAPFAASLAIPEYDGLSASQVVSRLTGLTPAELEAVRAYEAAGRGRKTILAAVDRLRRP